jgi:hypothetical protein
LIFVTPTRAVEFRLPQLPDEIGVGPTGATGIGSSVKPGGCFQRFMTEELPDQFICTWIGVESDLGAEMAELVRCDFYAEASNSRPLDRHPERPQTSRLAILGDEEAIRTSSNHRNRDLVAEHIKSVGKHRRQLFRS